MLRPGGARIAPHTPRALWTGPVRREPFVFSVSFVFYF
jgi:hypothetical protein